MQLVIENAKKYKNAILLTLCTLLTLPLVGTIIKIIFTYGTFVGTFIRNIAENGACF